MGGHIGPPLRKRKSSAVPQFRSGRRSLVCARLRNKGKRELRGWYSFNPRTAREQGLVAYGQTLVSTLLPTAAGAANPVQDIHKSKTVLNLCKTRVLTQFLLTVPCKNHIIKMYANRKDE